MDIQTGTPSVAFGKQLRANAGDGSDFQHISAGRLVCRIDPRNYGTGLHEIALPIAQLPAGQYLYSINDSRNALLASGSVVRQ